MKHDPKSTIALVLASIALILGLFSVLDRPQNPIQEYEAAVSVSERYRMLAIQAINEHKPKPDIDVLTDKYNESKRLVEEARRRLPSH